MTGGNAIPPESVWHSLKELAPRNSVGAVRAEEIAAILENIIVTNDVREGERLPSERDLARALDISRPTVSQAIRVLVVKGLVESRRGSGAYVTRTPETGLAASVELMLNLNHESVTQLSELRLWLETIGIAEAIARATDDEIAEAESDLDKLVSAVGDTSRWMSADTRFHATIVRAAHNPYLSSMYESVHTALINYEYRAWIRDGLVPEWLQAGEAETLNAVHVPILEALRNRDVDAGRRAVLRHHQAMSEHIARSHLPPQG